MAAEFDCSECGRHIIAITSDKPPLFRLCMLCLSMPGWFRHPEVRKAIDPEHDGREAWEREVP